MSRLHAASCSIPDAMPGYCEFNKKLERHVVQHSKISSRPNCQSRTSSRPPDAIPVWNCMPNKSSTSSSECLNGSTLNSSSELSIDDPSSTEQREYIHSNLRRVPGTQEKDFVSTSDSSIRKTTHKNNENGQWEGHGRNEKRELGNQPTEFVVSSTSSSENSFDDSIEQYESHRQNAPRDPQKGYNSLAKSLTIGEKSRSYIRVLKQNVSSRNQQKRLVTFLNSSTVQNTYETGKPSKFERDINANTKSSILQSKEKVHERDFRFNVRNTLRNQQRKLDASPNSSTVRNRSERKLKEILHDNASKSYRKKSYGNSNSSTIEYLKEMVESEEREYLRKDVQYASRNQRIPSEALSNSPTVQNVNQICECSQLACICKVAQQSVLKHQQRECNISSNSVHDNREKETVPKTKHGIAENQEIEIYNPSPKTTYLSNEYAGNQNENQVQITENVRLSKDCQNQNENENPLKCETLFSDDRKEFIEIKAKHNKLHYAGNLFLYFQNVSYQLSVGTVGEESFLAMNRAESKNCDEFLAKIEYSENPEFDYSASFQNNKIKFFDMFLITKVYEDRILNERDKAYCNFMETLKERIKNISDDIACREDMFQFLMLVDSNDFPLNNPLALLKEIIENECISVEVKKSAQFLSDVELTFSFRNGLLPKFKVPKEMPELLQKIRTICMEGIKCHKTNLFNECPNSSYKLSCLTTIENNSLDKKSLFISKQDIKLFSDLWEFLNDKHSDENISNNFIKKLWIKVFKTIDAEGRNKSVKKLRPITHPIYYFLLKYFYEVISEVCYKNKYEIELLIVFEEGELMESDFVNCLNSNLLAQSLKEQYQLLCKLLKHFEPGVYSYSKSFNYSYQLLKGDEDVYRLDLLKSVSEEQLVWLYIVDSGLAPLLFHNSQFKSLAQQILNSFIRFILQIKVERRETCRVATQKIIELFYRASSYVCNTYSILSSIDYKIINEQFGVFRKHILNSENTEEIPDHFNILLKIYVEYWDCRDSVIRKFPVPCNIFDHNTELVKIELLEIVQNAFTKNVEVSQKIKFFRLYNVFLKSLQWIDFNWYVSEHSYFPELLGTVEKLMKSDVTIYKVIRPDSFVDILNRYNKQTPDHASLETFKNLLKAISMALIGKDWTDEDSMQAVCNLLQVIFHSFSHFEDIVEHFLINGNTPFYRVISNSHTYSDFKRHLNRVEKFYSSATKENQIGVQQALNLCEQEVLKAEKYGFDSKFDRTILEQCYYRYSRKLLSLEDMDIVEILKEMEAELDKIEKLPLDRWTSNFKRNFLPDLTAYVASIWFLIEFKDIRNQVLCVFRVFGIDKTTTGVPKHFSQVLTGQGKSIIVALLSILIALTGNEAFVVCHNDYLAERDKNYFDKFFSTFQLFGVKDKISYNTVDSLARNMISCELDGTQISFKSYTEKFLKNKIQENNNFNTHVSERAVIIIDEVDVLLSESQVNPIRPVFALKLPAMLIIQPKLWEIIMDGAFDKNKILRQINEFIKELLEDESYKDLNTFFETSFTLFEKELKKMIEAALYISKSDTVNLMEENYEINENGICKRNEYCGISRTISSTDYKNIFIYFRLKKEDYDDKNYHNFGYVNVQVGEISYTSLFLRYHNILGVSGTLLDLCDFERTALKSFGIKAISSMPSFFGDLKLVFNSSGEHVSVLCSKSNWLSKIFRSVSKIIELKRAALVFFETDMELELFLEKYKSNIDRLYTITGLENYKTVESIVNVAGVAETVTLATRTMGRGIDYKSDDIRVKENGGIHVIQTFFSLDEKEEKHIKGRTARMNNKGSFELILCREHLEMLNCSKTDDGKLINTYAELCAIRKKIVNDNLTAAAEDRQ